MKKTKARKRQKSSALSYEKLGERRMLAPLVDIGITDNSEVAIVDHNAHVDSSTAQTPFVPNHHEPFLPNFASSQQIQGRDIFFSTGDGDWHEQFPLLGENDVVVINHDVQFNGVADVHSIVVHQGARLHFDINGSQRLHVVNLQVLAGGTLEIGTAARPHQGFAEIVFKDQAIDLSIDPGQYGNGLIVFGTVSIHGRQLDQTFANVESELLAGDSTISVSQSGDWQPGDEVVVPDSRQLFYTAPTVQSLDRYEVATLSNVQNDLLQLQDALEFDHLGGRDFNDRLLFTPYVANLTRSILIRSENPAGTRGHTIFIGRADIDIRYAEFRDLGRTLNQTLNSTDFDLDGTATTVGSNQAGRYAVHFHHLVGPSDLPASQAQFTFTGNSIHNTTENNLRWGVVVHGSHYGLVNKNVVYNVSGAGIVTEDGTESYNTFSENFVSRIAGNRSRGKFSAGFEGSGFWFKRPNNYVDNNVVTGADKAAYAVYGGDNTDVGTIRVPAFKGAAVHGGDYTLATPRTMHLLSFDSNEAYASHTGLEFWYLGFKTYYNPADEPVAQSNVNNFDAWNINFAGVFGEQANNVRFDNLRLINSTLVTSSNSVSRGFEIRRVKDVEIVNSTIENFRIGVEVPYRVDRLDPDLPFSEVAPFHLLNVKLRNNLNIEIRTPHEDAIAGASPRYTLIENVDFDDDPENIPAGKRNIRMRYSDGRFTNIIQQDVVEVVSFNRDPRANFQLFFSEQAPDFIVPQSGANGRFSPVGAPIAGQTNEGLWEDYGLAVAGQVAPGGESSGSRLTYTSVDGLAFPLTRTATGAAVLSISPDTGAVGDRRTAARRIIISGVADPSAEVQVFDYQRLLGSVVANENGLWSLDISDTPLASGEHQLTARINGSSVQSDSYDFLVATESPELIASPVAIAEDAEVGMIVQTLTAFDGDPDEILRFEITSGNEQGIFRIDSRTGEISLARGGVLDPDIQSNYQLGVRVVDSVGWTDDSILDVEITGRPPGFYITQLQHEQFSELSPEEILFLTPQQIATIPSSYSFRQIPAASRAALTPEQLSGLDTSKPGMLGLLTHEQQIGLSDAQYANLSYSELSNVPPERASAITTAQLASLPNSYWLRQISIETRLRFNQVQVNAIDFSKSGMINSLPPTQVSLLTTESLSQLNYTEFRYLGPHQILQLSREQLSSVPGYYWYIRITSESRIALSAAGINWVGGRFVFS